MAFLGKIKDAFRFEGKSLEFSAKPLVIMLAAAVFILLERYNGCDVITAMAWLFGIGLARDLRAVGLGPGFIIQLILPILLLVLIRVSLRDAGLGPGKIKPGLKIMGICALLYIPFFIILKELYNLCSFAQTYRQNSCGVRV